MGGGAPRIAPAMTCKLCMILSSAEGTGTERCKWQKFDGIQDDLALGVGLDYLEAAVGI
jgi:hypothetical protein